MDNLNQYKTMADGIAALFAPQAEVVVHDLASQQICYLANNYSNREIGSPSLLDEVEFKPGERIIGPYRKTNWDGRILKSISMVMNGPDNRPEALICINMDVTEMDRMQNLLSMMVQAPKEGDAVDALFKDDWHERINHSIQEWLHETGLTLQALDRTQKRELVMALNAKGAFQGQGSANYVAKCLGLGRATVYKYLKESKG